MLIEEFYIDYEVSDSNNITYLYFYSDVRNMLGLEYPDLYEIHKVLYIPYKKDKVPIKAASLWDGALN